MIAAQAPPAASAQQVAERLRREPIALASWAAWRGRLLAWTGERDRRRNPACDAAWAFLLARDGDGWELPPALGQDAFAWYLLGGACLRASRAGPVGDAALAPAG